MNTTQLVTVRPKVYGPSVKKLVISSFNMVIIRKIAIFASVIAGLLAWAGAIIESPATIAAGVAVALIGFMPWFILRSAIELDKLNTRR